VDFLEYILWKASFLHEITLERKLFAKYLCVISCYSDSLKISKIVSVEVLFKKLGDKFKEPKTLQMSLHLEYYISTNHHKNS